MKNLIDQFDKKIHHPDLGIFILRVGFSVMLLLHGINKVTHGTDFIQGLLIELHLPAFIAYGVYVGEIIAPLLIIVGVFTRLSALVMIATCLAVIGLVHIGDFFTLDSHGAWSVESIATYLFASLTIMLMGSGKYALRPDR